MNFRDYLTEAVSKGEIERRLNSVAKGIKNGINKGSQPGLTSKKQIIASNALGLSYNEPFVEALKKYWNVSDSEIVDILTKEISKRV
mgnify:CR=1 FL=1